MVKFDDLENAFFFVNASIGLSNHAVLNKKTGKIFYESEDEDMNEIPDDIDFNDDYVWIPDKNELELGTSLVYDFAAAYIPEHYNEVRQIFQRSGAYRRFKDFLLTLDMLEKWHAYEDQRRKEALLQWCEYNGIEVDLS